MVVIIHILKLNNGNLGMPQSIIIITTTITIIQTCVSNQTESDVPPVARWATWVKHSRLCKKHGT